MRIVVTGALGHIGSRLIRSLPDAFPEAEIVLVDNLLTQRYASLFDLPSSGKYNFVEADVLSDDIDALIAGAHAVVHLAAITNAAESFSKQDEVERVNFKGTDVVARACLRADAQMVFLSTTSVYGVQAGVVAENCPREDLKPQSPYAASKLRAENLLAHLGDEGLRYTSLRFGTIVGPSVGMRFHTAVNKFCWQAVMGQPLTVWRAAVRQRRPYLELGDAVRSIEFVLGRRIGSDVYNVVTANATVEEIVQLVRGVIPDLKVEEVDSPVMNQLSYEVDSSKFRSLGFEFQGDLRDAIFKTVAHLRAAGGRPDPMPLPASVRSD